MPTDFWTLIGSCSVETSDDVKSALDQVSARLDALEPPDLVHFAAQLEEHLHRIDRRELAEVPVVFRGEQFPQTADHFLYARCACILAGEEAYRNSARSPVQFARFVKPAVQGAENLLYLARSSYEKKVGRRWTDALR